MLGKCRRVENYQIILVAHTVEILEGIFGKSFVAKITGEVQFYVLVSQIDCFGGAVHGMYQFRASTHGVERKATGIAEHIQY